MDTSAPFAEISQGFRALLERMRAGSDDAFAELHALYAEPLLAAIRHWILPPNDPLRQEIDSWDLTQQGWLALLTALKQGRQFTKGTQLLGYILAALRNFSNDRRRKRARLAGGTLPRDVQFDPALHDRGDAGFGSAEEAELAEECAAFLATLVPHRRAVMLLVAAGRTRAEIAAEMGYDVRSVQRYIKESLESFLRHSSEGSLRFCGDYAHG
jgi:RNA polymerase sigma factor (sigma-70 family)